MGHLGGHSRVAHSPGAFPAQLAAVQAWKTAHGAALVRMVVSLSVNIALIRLSGRKIGKR